AARQTEEHGIPGERPGDRARAVLDQVAAGRRDRAVVETVVAALAGAGDDGVVELEGSFVPDASAAVAAAGLVAREGDVAHGRRSRGLVEEASALESAVAEEGAVEQRRAGSVADPAAVQTGISGDGALGECQPASGCVVDAAAHEGRRV